MASNRALLANVIFLGPCLAIRCAVLSVDILLTSISEFDSDGALFEESAFRNSTCLSPFLGTAWLKMGPSRKLVCFWALFPILYVAISA